MCKSEQQCKKDTYSCWLSFRTLALNSETSRAKWFLSGVIPLVSWVADGEAKVISTIWWENWSRSCTKSLRCLTRSWYKWFLWESSRPIGSSKSLFQMRSGLSVTSLILGTKACCVSVKLGKISSNYYLKYTISCRFFAKWRF